MNVAKSVVVVVIGFLFVACGGGGGGGGGSVAQGPSLAPAAPVMLGGTAAKGLVLGGRVTAYVITDSGGKGAQIGESATTSTTDGGFELELPSNYDGSPFIIEVTAQDGTLMRCDLVRCSSDPLTEFGDDYSLGPNFVLRAISEGVESDLVSINLSVLSTMAAELALKRIDSGAGTIDAIAVAKSQVSSLFGIAGDVNDVEVLDITNLAEVSEADPDTIEANLINAALAQSSLQRGLGLEDGVEATVLQYVDIGFADNDAGTDDSSVITREEIFSEALVLISEMEKKAQDEEVQPSGTLSETKTTMSALAQVAAESLDTVANQGDVDPNAGSKGLVATKQFVKQVRDLSNAAGLDEALNKFDMEVSLAEQIADQNVQAIVIAVEEFSSAVSEAYEMVSNGDSGSLLASNGLTVSTTTNGQTTTYRVDAPPGASVYGIPITGYMSFTDNGTVISVEEQDNSPDSYERDSSVSIDVAVEGELSATTDQTTTLTITEGSNVILTLSETIDESIAFDSASSTSEYVARVDGGVSITAISLEVTLEQSEIAEVLENPVTFAGSIDISNSNFTYKQSVDVIFNSTSFNESVQLDESLESVMLQLSGQLSNGFTTIDATLSLDLRNLDSTCTLLYGSDGTWSEICEDNDSELDFPTGSVTISFDASLEGLSTDNTVNILATLSREKFDTVGLDIELMYAGLMLDIEASDYVDSAEAIITNVSITNQAGVTLNLTAEEDDLGELRLLEGAISLSGVTYADLSENADGIVIITYKDGTFESL